MSVLCLSMLCRVNENSDKEYMFIQAEAIDGSIQMPIVCVPFNLLTVWVDVIRWLSTVIRWLSTMCCRQSNQQPVGTNYAAQVF